MAMGTMVEVMPFLSLFQFPLSLARGWTRIVPKNADLHQKNRRLSAQSVFFRSIRGVEEYAVTLQSLTGGCDVVVRSYPIPKAYLLRKIVSCYHQLQREQCN